MVDNYPPFERTTCACTQCVEFCSRPAHLIPTDLQRIGQVLTERGDADSPTDTARYFRASSGTKVGIYTKRGLAIVTVPTITPRVENGRCVFLTSDNRCSIHAVSPFGCAYFDAHMPRDESDERVKWSIREISQSASYKAFRALLEERGGEAIS